MGMNEMTDPHTLWAVAQLTPGEGIEDGVARIAALLAESLDCRTCSHMYWTKTKGVIGCESPNYCVNADRYDTLPPVRLYRKE